VWGGGSPFKGWINLEKGPTAQFVMICAQLRKNRPQLMSTIVEKEGGGGLIVLGYPNLVRYTITWENGHTTLKISCTIQHKSSAIRSPDFAHQKSWMEAGDRDYWWTTNRSLYDRQRQFLLGGRKSEIELVWTRGSMSDLFSKKSEYKLLFVSHANIFVFPSLLFCVNCFLYFLICWMITSR